MSRLEIAFAENDFAKAKKILKKEAKYRHLESQYRMAHLERVQKEKTKSTITHEIHMELMDMLKQIHVYLRSMAEAIIDLNQNDNEQKV